MNLVDIVIVNYKSTDHLIRCLQSISRDLTKESLRVFVEDNGSDGKIDQVKAMFPEVVVSRNPENLGFAKAVNRSSRKGSAPYLMILNPDTLIVENFFSHVLSYMERNPKVGVLGPRIFNADGTLQGSARAFPTPLTAFFGRRSLLTKWFPTNKISRQNLLTAFSDGITPMEVDWVSGACMLVRREAIEEIGPLDERFFMYWEDADWCKRMWQGGWKVVYFPAASIVHLVGASSERLVFRSILEFHKSSYRLIQKYGVRWISFIKPFVIGGLALRIVFALAMNRANRWYRSHKGPVASEEKHPNLQQNAKTKVLRLISRLNIGGPAIHVSLLSRFLNRDRFETVLIYGTIPSHEGDMTYLLNSPNILGVRVPEIRREISLWNDVLGTIRVFKLLKIERPDIVHTHTSKAGAIGRLAVLFYNVLGSKKIITVHTFHGNVFDGYFSRQKAAFYVWTERMLASFTNVIIAISESQKKELAEKFHIAPAEKIRKIELGFELQPFLSCSKLKGRFRKKSGIENSVFLVGTIGRLVPIKNHIIFLKSARIFLDENPETPIKFLVVGNGELRSKLERYCREKGLSENVLFCGWVRNVVSVYADLDALLLTSLNEGTPVSIIEAMASSVPVISADAGGVHDLLGQARTPFNSNSFKVCQRGILCRKDEPTEFADGLKYLLTEKESERRERLARACDFVAKRFTKERLLKDIQELYAEVLKGKEAGY